MRIAPIGPARTPRLPRPDAGASASPVVRQEEDRLPVFTDVESYKNHVIKSVSEVQLAQLDLKKLADPSQREEAEAALARAMHHLRVLKGLPIEELAPRPNFIARIFGARSGFDQAGFWQEQGFGSLEPLYPAGVLRKKIHEAEQALEAARKAARKAAGKEARPYERKLKDLDREIRNAEAGIKGRELDIAAYDGNLQAQLARERSQLSYAEGELARTQSALNQPKLSFEEKQRLQRRLDSDSASVRVYSASVASLESKLATKETRIPRLRADIASYKAELADLHRERGHYAEALNQVLASAERPDHPLIAPKLQALEALQRELEAALERERPR